MGKRGKALRKALAIMEFKELRAEQAIPEVPIPCRLKESRGPQIDYAWVEGITCSEMFAGLEPYERYILYLTYHDDLPDRLEALGVSKASYYRVVAMIRRKIANAC